MADSARGQRRAPPDTNSSDSLTRNPPTGRRNPAAVKRRSRLEQRYSRSKSRPAGRTGLFVVLTSSGLGAVFVLSIVLTIILSLTLQQLNLLDKQVRTQIDELSRKSPEFNEGPTADPAQQSASPAVSEERQESPGSQEGTSDNEQVTGGGDQEGGDNPTDDKNDSSGESNQGQGGKTGKENDPEGKAEEPSDEIAMPPPFEGPDSDDKVEWTTRLRGTLLVHQSNEERIELRLRSDVQFIWEFTCEDCKDPVKDYTKSGRWNINEDNLTIQQSDCEYPRGKTKAAMDLCENLPPRFKLEARSKTLTLFQALAGDEGVVLKHYTYLFRTQGGAS